MCLDASHDIKIDIHRFDTDILESHTRFWININQSVLHVNGTRCFKVEGDDLISVVLGNE